MSPQNQAILSLENLSVRFRVHKGYVDAVRNVSYSLAAGETLCVVGESGSGKSVTVQTIVGILPMPPGEIIGGKIIFNNLDLLKAEKNTRRSIMGRDIAMIFQDPLVSLNPTMTVLDQVAETLVLHTNMSTDERRKRVVELLELVKIPDPEKRLKQYPHELSGGQRQRVMIAMALACNPKILIADEPTTALDVTIQAQILELIKELGRKLNMATIFITHDLGVVARMADRVVVMYAGQVIEEGDVFSIFEHPRHPYTLGLKGAIPMPEEDKDHGRLQSIPGSPPDLFSPPVGCSFAPRCEFAMKVCHVKQPPYFTSPANKTLRTACWLHHEYGEKYRVNTKIDALPEPSMSI